MRLSRQGEQVCFRIFCSAAIAEATSAAVDRVEAVQGIGIGLAMARKCVELHEGEINFHSSADEGTTIIVMLPLKPN